MSKRTSSGYILLLSVLVVGAVGTAIATSILMLSVGNSLNSLADQQSAEALSYANACAEDTLEQLRIDNTYVAGEVLTFDKGTCEVISVQGTGDTNRTVQAEGVVGDIVRKIEIIVDDIGPPTVISRWQDVDQF